MSVADISKMEGTPVQEAEIVAERTPEIVAAEIRQIADQTRKMVLNSSIEIGKRLCEAKEMVPHGEWAAWLEKNVDFSQSSANNFMKIYTEYGDIQGELWGASAKSQTFGNLSYSQAVALLAVPAEEREEFVKENHVEDMSTRELQEAIKARDEAIKARDEAMDDCVKADTAKLEAEEKLKEEMKAADERVRAAQRQAESVMEELDKLKDEVKNSKDKKELEKLKTQLKDAKDKLKAHENLHSMQMEEANTVQIQNQKEINRLKEQLAAAEARESTATLEEAAEIERLKAKLADAEKNAGDEKVAEFKIVFQDVQDNFYRLMDIADKIKDKEAGNKRRRAIKKLLETLLEELGV